MSTASVKGLIDLGQPILWLSAATIIFNPTFWNTAARSEYRNKNITKLFGGNSLYGCYALAVTIFSIGIIRDAMYVPISFPKATYYNIAQSTSFQQPNVNLLTRSYEKALRTQPSHPLLETSLAKVAAVALFAAGNTLVLTSMWALGLTGTYLGDYFGILMDEMVTGFPFNVSSAPMYHGSTMSFLGSALWFGKPAGVALSVLVLVVYQIALTYEDPFTANIYAEREKNKPTVPKGGRTEPQGGRIQPKGGKIGPKEL
ncbi:phospholipid methyltransferase [Myriangium duriaei CBS 260.36]|uniref:Phosphatidyl-N-methylethanolamine N-methyltransferase n=1 Tax=Myriangium duriaei CBS 260.36 TaxID=1168546 RepID=A0A9P4J2I5_9PEZI|nr:phospholipid methyltransferase [Myriangium duriaei CBS 260.36]